MYLSIYRVRKLHNVIYRVINLSPQYHKYCQVSRRKMIIIIIIKKKVKHRLLINITSYCRVLN